MFKGPLIHHWYCCHHLKIADIGSALEDSAWSLQSEAPIERDIGDSGREPQHVGITSRDTRNTLETSWVTVVIMVTVLMINRYLLDSTGPETMGTSSHSSHTNSSRWELPRDVSITKPQRFAWKCYFHSRRPPLRSTADLATSSFPRLLFFCLPSVRAQCSWGQKQNK